MQSFAATSSISTSEHPRSLAIRTRAGLDFTKVPIEVRLVMDDHLSQVAIHLGEPLGRNASGSTRGSEETAFTTYAAGLRQEYLTATLRRCQDF